MLFVKVRRIKFVILYLSPIRTNRVEEEDDAQEPREEYGSTLTHVGTGVHQLRINKIIKLCLFGYTISEPEISLRRRR